MYKMIGLSIIVLVSFLSHFIHATDNSQWCGTITAIYGVCSPELIANFLAKSSYNTPRVVIPKMKPQANPPIAIASSVSTLLTEANATTEPNVRYTWYWNNVKWIRGRLVG